MLRAVMVMAVGFCLAACSPIKNGGGAGGGQNAHGNPVVQGGPVLSVETPDLSGVDDPEYSCVVPTLGERWQRVYEIAGRFYEPILNCTGFVQHGIASWYGIPFHGRETSNGEIFDMNKVSAAHKTLPLGIWIKVTNLDNGRELIVRVNDRGPYCKDRVLDLSVAAAKELGYYGVGTAPVVVEALGYARSDRLSKGLLAVDGAMPVNLYTSPFNPREVIYGSHPRAGEYLPEQVKPNYTVQVAAFKTAEKAGDVLLSVQSRFRGAVMKAYPKGDALVYCIRLENFASRQEAEGARKCLAEIGFPRTMILLESFEKNG